MSHILFLNGPSSSGKTTLAKALQEEVSDPFLHIGIDKVIGMMPNSINDWTGKKSEQGFWWKRERDQSGKIMQTLQMGEYAKKVVQAYKEMALLLAQREFNLIIDEVSLKQSTFLDWKTTLSDFNVLFIGVFASLQTLEAREKARNNRIIGSARAQYYSVHQGISYDVNIDTDGTSLQQNIDCIKAAWEKKFKVTL